MDVSLNFFVCMSCFSLIIIIIEEAWEWRFRFSYGSHTIILLIGQQFGHLVIERNEAISRKSLRFALLLN